MKRSLYSLLVLAAACAPAFSQSPVAQLAAPTVLTNKEVLLSLQATPGQRIRIEASADLVRWSGLSTLSSSSATQALDSATPWLSQRFYRAVPAATNAIIGDHLETTDGEVTIRPVNHASFVLVWNGKTIYCDPVGAASQYAGLPKADLVLVTHEHSDHFNAGTISAVTNAEAIVFAPRVVYQALPASLKAIGQVLTNGASTNVLGLSVEAVPAYNLTANYHGKGSGNGYVITIGGKRIYVSGDTEDIPEMRALADIDVAFVCMNLPFTMSVDKAVSAVREFKPKVVYLYHYRPYGPADVNQFKEEVGDAGVEVRLRQWY